MDELMDGGPLNFYFCIFVAARAAHPIPCLERRRRYVQKLFS